MTSPTSPFRAIIRQILAGTSQLHLIVDADGRAWWAITGSYGHPEGWKELSPLPGDTPAVKETLTAQPDDLALRVQRLEAMRETERVAITESFRQIDELKQRIDWQYTKIGRLEDVITAQQKT